MRPQPSRNDRLDADGVEGRRRLAQPGPQRQAGYPTRPGGLTNPLPNADLRVGSTFQVHLAIAYEDLPTGRRALKVYQRLQQHPVQGCQCRCQWWQFDELLAPGSLEKAARQMAEADIGLISAHGKSELPGHVQRWIELSFEKTPGPGVLVGLLDPHPVGASSRVREYLMDLAQALSVPLLLEETLGVACAGQNAGDDRVLTVSDFSIGRLVGGAYPRWGINE